MTDRDGSTPRRETPPDSETHARHAAAHPEWARYRRPGAEDGDAEAATGLVHEAAAPVHEATGPVDAPGLRSEPAVLADGRAVADRTDIPSPAALPSGAPTGWRPPTALDPALEARIRRDLARGRRIVRLTWAAALASVVLGLVAVRQSTLLVAIDPRLVTTEEVQAAGSSFDAARTVLVLAVLLGVVLAVRWLRDGLRTFADLRALGVVEGPDPGNGVRRLALLWRPAGVPAEAAGWADLRVGNGRRLAWLTVGAVGLAAVVGLVAALWLGAARDADTSRLLRVVSGVDGALWLLASILVGASFDAILWREAAAARALGVFIPLVDAPSRPIVRLLPPALLFAAGVFVASGRPEPWFVPCPSATLTCDGMLVPVDHGNTAGATLWVVYAEHHAAGPPAGTLAIAVGGPGSSGLDQATSILDGLDEELVRRYNILFFDQRGVGASEGRDCPDAGFRYATTVPDVTAAREFAAACIREAEVDPASVARYSTHQAAEDLDSIRERLRIPKFALYGESYGTELAQAYAALHPDRLTTLILDGPVDLTLSANRFWADAAHGFERVLDDTLAACATEPDCKADLDQPAEAFDDLSRALATGRTVSFADPDGEVRDHDLDGPAFEAAVETMLYDPAGRMIVQRAVAASAHGDYVPAAKLVLALGGGQGLGVSSFAYHAITCADYRVSPTANPQDFAAVQAAGAAAGVDELRTEDVYTSQLACLFWPYQPADGSRPAPLTTTPYPVLVLGATDDPITPIAGAEAIAGRLSDGYLIRTRGGPHVTFGRGVECVDQPVLRLLLDGRRPATRIVDCGDRVAARYIPLTGRSEADYDDALEAMASAEDEVFADPAYVLWDHEDELRFGCREGGFVAIRPVTLEDDIRFADCAFVPGLAMTGTGSYVFATQTVTWKVKAESVDVEYTSTRSDRHVEGTWEGRPVDLRR